jgi:hypothetical protein
MNCEAYNHNVAHYDSASEHSHKAYDLNIGNPYTPSEGEDELFGKQPIPFALLKGFSCPSANFYN